MNNRSLQLLSNREKYELALRLNETLDLFLKKPEYEEDADRIRRNKIGSGFIESMEEGIDTLPKAVFANWYDYMIVEAQKECIYLEM